MDKHTFDPSKISTAALNRNKNIAGRIHWMLVFMQAGRFEEASELADNLVKGLAEQDATLRTLRDVATHVRTLSGSPCIGTEGTERQDSMSALI